MAKPENVLVFPTKSTKQDITCREYDALNDPQHSPGESDWMVTGLGVAIIAAIIIYGFLGYFAIKYFLG